MVERKEKNRRRREKDRRRRWREKAGRRRWREKDRRRSRPKKWVELTGIFSKAKMSKDKMLY